MNVLKIVFPDRLIPHNYVTDLRVFFCLFENERAVPVCEIEFVITLR